MTGRAAAALSGVLLCWALPAGVAAQRAGGAPLRKSDLVRLLSNPLIQRSEVAAVVRRNCLAFHPTERDWSDLRGLGADSDVMGSVGECAARGTQRTALAGALPSTSLIAAFLTPRVAAAVGTQAFVPIQVKRADGTEARGVSVVLRATSYVPGGPSGELKAVTDDSGFSVFGFQVGRLPGRYRLELVGGGSGVPFLGRPGIDLLVSPGPPAVAQVQPPRLELGLPGQPAAGLVVAIRDSFGNGVPREPIELRAASAAMGLPADTQATDSLGRVSFAVRRAALREPGQLEVRARGTTLAALDVVIATPPPPSPPRPEPAPPSGLEAGFVRGAVRSGSVRTRLADALTFAVRGRAGNPVQGRVVRFQGVNAQVEPDSAVTNSAGQVQLQVVLGSKAGIAVVAAVVDSLRTEDTLDVQPGAAFELSLERDGQRVDGGRILVELGVPFALRLRARDRYGNLTSTASLTGRLQELRSAYNSRADRRLELLAVQPEDLAAVLTFKPVQLGSTDVQITVGLTTAVAVEVVAASR